MNTGAVFVVRLAAGLALAVFFIVVLWPGKLSNVRMLAPLAQGKGLRHWMLRLVLALAAAHFAAAALMLMAAAAAAYFYTFALAYGELFLQLPHMGKTAGAVCVQIIFPVQVFLAGTIALAAAVAGWIEVIGPLPDRWAGRLTGNLPSRMAFLLGVIACLEILRVLLVGLLAPADRAVDFFAVNVPPKMDVLPLALMAAGVGVGAAVFILWMKRGGDES